MLEIKGIRFDVEINRKRIRNLYLRVDGNKIVVSAPLRMPDYEIYRFIENRRDWIYRTYDYNAYKTRVSKTYHGGDIFYLHNTPYHLVRKIGRSNVKILDDTIILTYKDDSDNGIKYLYKHLDRYLLVKAKEYLDRHIDLLEEYGYEQMPELKARIMTSRWGVCYTRKNSICISSYLIHYPEECLEYIMIHEMTHFIVPNHSKRFYRIVSSRMPDYKKALEKLKL
ncbi:MAG: M48 family metallopeptidase [Erysipelotrichaceae bacterium]|nr:M48 family metallopeptidase [Erysipelotrichaceae bacterium]